MDRAVPEWKSLAVGGFCHLWAMWGKWVRLTVLSWYGPGAAACGEGRVTGKWIACL